MVRLIFAALMILPATAHAALDVITTRYTCERGVVVPVVYVNAGDEGSVVTLWVEGGLVTLYAEQSASGARYGWPSDGSNYVWWSKGRDATLLWKDAPKGSETAILSDCVAAQ